MRDLEAPLLRGEGAGGTSKEDEAATAPQSPLGTDDIRLGADDGRLSECSALEHLLAEEEPMPGGAAPGECGLGGGIANLVTTAVGAGMLALPCAVQKTGVLLGAALFALVAGLTFASCSIIVSYAARYGVASYGDLVTLLFRRRGARLLQVAIAVHVSGVMIGYCVIIADVLVGSAPAYHGVLPSLLGRHDGPWWLSRPAVLAGLILAVVVPTLVPRSLRVVARFSSFSVCMLFLLASAISGLALLAVAKGQVAPGVSWLPAAADIGDTPLAALSSVLTVVSVASLAYTCQFNLLPIQASLRDNSAAGMHRVLVSGLAFCAVLYSTVAIGGYTLFGSSTEGDVLKNLTSRFVATLVPPLLARAIVYGVACSYTLCLLANFVLKVWAVREAVADLLVRRCAAQLAPLPFYALTYALVAAAYGVSVLVPSIYGLLALVGATATVVFSYLFPGLIVLWSKPTAPQRAGASALLALGACMTATAIYDHLTGRSLE